MSLSNNRISGSGYTYQRFIGVAFKNEKQESNPIVNNKTVIGFLMGYYDTLWCYQNFDVYI